MQVQKIVPLAMLAAAAIGGSASAQTVTTSHAGPPVTARPVVANTPAANSLAGTATVDAAALARGSAVSAKTLTVVKRTPTYSPYVAFPTHAGTSSRDAVRFAAYQARLEARRERALARRRQIQTLPPPRHYNPGVPAADALGKYQLQHREIGTDHRYRPARPPEPTTGTLTGGGSSMPRRLSRVFRSSRSQLESWRQFEPWKIQSDMKCCRRSVNASVPIDSNPVRSSRTNC